MSKSKYPEITLVKGAIHSPKEPRHFMTVDKITRNIQVSLDVITVANADFYFECSEVANVIISPVPYLRKESVNLNLLRESDKSTYCPLKGTANYYHLKLKDRVIEDCIWCYHEVLTCSLVLKDLFAFDNRVFQINISS